MQEICKMKVIVSLLLTTRESNIEKQTMKRASERLRFRRNWQRWHFKEYESSSGWVITKNGCASERRLSVGWKGALHWLPRLSFWLTPLLKPVFLLNPRSETFTESNFAGIFFIELGYLWCIVTVLPQICKRRFSKSFSVLPHLLINQFL